MEELNSIINVCNFGGIVLDTSEDVFMNIFNKHVPIKFKYVRANDGPFMTKQLQKEVMIRSNLKNICNRDKSDAFYLAYKKQRNKCTNLLRKAKRTFYNNLNPSLRKLFGKLSSPFFFWIEDRPMTV